MSSVKDFYLNFSKSGMKVTLVYWDPLASLISGSVCLLILSNQVIWKLFALSCVRRVNILENILVNLAP